MGLPGLYDTRPCNYISVDSVLLLTNADAFFSKRMAPYETTSDANVQRKNDMIESPPDGKNSEPMVPIKLNRI